MQEVKHKALFAIEKPQPKEVSAIEIDVSKTGSVPIWPSAIRYPGVPFKAARIIMSVTLAQPFGQILRGSFHLFRADVWNTRVRMTRQDVPSHLLAEQEKRVHA
jgi:hypothetical protein